MSAKVVTVEQQRGHALISSDLHGNRADFERLRELFLDGLEAGEPVVWISTGDWVHGPDGQARQQVNGHHGEALYDYPDESAAIARELLVLSERFPRHFYSVCGNHEWAHIGGPRTSKFHDDEAEFLEQQLAPTEVSMLRQLFTSWPLLVRLPACGLVVSHGAIGSGFAHAADFERIDYRGSNDSQAAALLWSAMSAYGYVDDDPDAVLRHLSGDGGEYQLLVHGHDREETGLVADGACGLLLCSSFGACQDRKAYLWLELGERYHLGNLREGEEVRFLW